MSTNIRSLTHLLFFLSLPSHCANSSSPLCFFLCAQAVDNLFRQLIDNGYPCLALHGGMDQQDRDFTLSDFKAGQRSILIATSVVARGLDVRDCVLVINYTTPNHYEDYVHRVGRTGRAGRTGTAITLVQPDEQAIAVELVRGLRESKQVVPQDLEAMAAEWLKKRKAGGVKWGVNGFGGKGFKFDEVEEAERREKERVLRLQFNPDADQAELAQLQDELKEREDEKRKKEAEQQSTAQSSSGYSRCRYSFRFSVSTSTAHAATRACRSNRSNRSPDRRSQSRCTGRCSVAHVQRNRRTSSAGRQGSQRKSREESGRRRSRTRQSRRPRSHFQISSRRLSTLRHRRRFCCSQALRHCGHQRLPAAGALGGHKEGIAGRHRGRDGLCGHGQGHVAAGGWEGEGGGGGRWWWWWCW